MGQFDSFRIIAKSALGDKSQDVLVEQILEFFLQKINDWNIGISEKRDFVDATSLYKIRDTHLICMFKREVIERGLADNIPTKRLDALIRKFLEASKNAGIYCLNKDPYLKSQSLVDVKRAFL